MSLEKTIYIGPFIHCETPTTLDICIWGVIGVDEQGTISFIRRSAQGKQLPNEPGWEDARIVRINSKHSFFFPGFIDTHIHAPQYPNSGIFGKSTLLDWLETYTFPMEGSFSDLEQAARVYNRVVARTLANGTTTACYYATIHVPATNLLADVCYSRGQRAFVGRTCMDRMSPDYYRDASAERSVEDTKACIEHVRSIDPEFDLVSPIITPRFAPSCSQQSLHALGRLHAESGVPCQTHISENKNEIKLVKELFPDAPHYAGVYDEAGLLTSRTILAHAVHLTAEERELVKQRDAKISHCPVSNSAITSGVAPVRQLLDDGITVGLGTDVSGGYTCSILAESREAVMVSRHRAILEDGREECKLSVEEALYLATRGGAKVVGLDNKIGGFEVGKQWDAQLVALGEVPTSVVGALDQHEGPVDVFGGETWEEKVAKWVYTGDDRNTCAVWVRGRLVHCKDGFQPSTTR